MIDFDHKVIDQEELSYRDFIKILNKMSDPGRVLRRVTIFASFVNQIPKTVRITERIVEKKPWWKFWRKPKVTEYFFGFRVDGLIVIRNTFITKDYRS